MERELDDVISDSSVNEEEDQADESEEKSLLNSIPRKALDTTYCDDEKNPCIHALCCNWESVKTIVIIAFIWIGHFLCFAAISTIGPFFPKEVWHHLISRFSINVFIYVQGKGKGASPAIIGIIVGISPLCVVIVSPFVGYLVCPSNNPKLKT